MDWFWSQLYWAPVSPQRVWPVEGPSAFGVVSYRGDVVPTMGPEAHPKDLGEIVGGGLGRPRQIVTARMGLPIAPDPSPEGSRGVANLDICYPSLLLMDLTAPVN